MKAKKLLRRLGEFLSADEATQYEEIKATRRTLKALKKKESSLKERLVNADGSSESESIKTKLDVIYAQRKKGVKRIQELAERQP